MSTRLHLDTHVVVWLYGGQHQRFPAGVRDRLESAVLVISPMVRLELAYLHEIERLVEPPERIIAELVASLGLLEDTTGFSSAVTSAMQLTFTRDPFDRVILGQAIAARASLVTKDRRMREAAPSHTFWDRLEAR